MKKALFCIAVILTLGCTEMLAQNPARPNTILAKKLFLDHHTPDNGALADFGNYTDGFEVAYLRNLNPYLNAVLPLKVGVIKLPSELNNRKIFGLDGQLQVQYFKEKNLAVPYAMAGVGTVMEDFEDLDFQIPFGLGVNFKLGTFGFINLQAEYRKSLSLDRDHLQYGLGLGFMLGKYTDEELELPIGKVTITDTDEDGIADQDDNCPQEAGLAALGGCPDADGDNIADREDNCPEEFGPRSTRGCPDTDNDGVANLMDKCPDVAGSLEGCPDSDGDGVADKDDRCPNEAGKAEHDGCPTRDSDGDGIPDHRDECPDVAGTINGCPDSDKDGIADKNDACPYAAGEGRFNGCPDTDKDGIEDSKDRCPNMAAPSSPTGCPEIKQEDREVLDYAIQAIQFEFGSAILKQQSYAVLDQVYDVLSRYGDYKVNIEGHTDDVGTEENNLNLSIRRAKACYDYLQTKGISTTRMGYGGFGESRPIDNNNSEEGRKLNRRVEFNLQLR
ncbi:MAG: OmpA family protein [Bacteroidota bacterium]